MEMRRWTVPQLYPGPRRRPHGAAAGIRPSARAAPAEVLVGSERGSELALASPDGVPRPLALAPATGLGTSTLTGREPSEGGEKANQDAYFAVRLPEHTCLGILDGHGPDGHLLAGFLATDLPGQILEEVSGPMRNSARDERLRELEELLATVAHVQLPSAQAPIHSILVRSFHQAQADAEATPDVPTDENAGATCTVCLVDERQIHVAHVGDSRAILVPMGGGDVQALTEDTTIQMDDEYRRIEKGAGGILKGYVWYNDRGLAITRALGDTDMLRAGVVPTPLVRSFRRPLDATRLVLATDGVWDALSNELVAEIVREAESAQAASDALTAAARESWIGPASLMGLIRPRRVDDITCVVLDL